MKLNGKLKRKIAGTISAFLTVCQLAGIGTVAFATETKEFSLYPRTEYKIFDSYGNMADGYIIDEGISIFPSSSIETRRPTKEIVLNDYEKSESYGAHPRLLATQADFDAMKIKIETDPFFQKEYQRVLKEAENLLELEPIVLDIDEIYGGNLWLQSCDFMDRIFPLGIAYKMTDDRKYADRAYEEMLAMIEIDTWREDQVLVQAGLSLGYAIGYDWFYDAYTDNQREVILRGASKHFLKGYLGAYQGTQSHMKNNSVTYTNINGVVNGCAIAAGMAFLDEFPESSAYIIAKASRALEYGLVNYIDSGSWHEGVSYGTMQLQYLGIGMAALDKVFGHTYGIDKVENINKAVDFLMDMQCSAGSLVHSDSPNSNVNFYSPAYLWLTDYFGGNSGQFIYDLYYETPGPLEKSLTLLWGKPIEEIDIERDTGTYYKDARNPIVVMRSSWNSKYNTFAGIKGGTQKRGYSSSHAHIDSGAFSFSSDGVFWTTDVGAEDYNKAGYGEFRYSETDADRWDYYRTRAEAHNCIIINPDEKPEYVLDALSDFETYQENDFSAFSILDMTEAQAEDASSAKRGTYLADNRQSLVVRDEITLLNDNSTLNWFMSTPHNVEIQDDKSVILTNAGADTSKQLKIEFLCNKEIEVTAGPAEPLPTSPIPADGNVRNTNITRIKVAFGGNAGEAVALTAKLTPVGIENPEGIEKYNVPISQWALSENTTPVLKLKSEVPAERMPDGIRIDVYGEVIGAPEGSYVKIYEESNGNLTEVEKSITNEAEVTVSKDEKYAVIKLFSNQNEELLSKRISLMGIDETNKTRVWDVDFNTHQAVKENPNNANVYIYGPDGTRLKNNDGSTLSGHCGALNTSSITIENSPTDENEKCLKLVTVTGASNLAQLNGFYAVVDGGISTYSMDYYLEDTNNRKMLMGLYGQTEGGTGKYIGNTTANGPFVTAADGKILFGKSSMKHELKRWYNITCVANFNTKTVDCIIDGKYFGTITTEDVVKLTRMNLQMGSDLDTTAYVDNFKVYKY